MNRDSQRMDELISRLLPEVSLICWPEGNGLPVSRLREACSEQVVNLEDRKVIGVLVQGSVPDAVLLTPPPTTSPRWVFVFRRADGTHSCRGWGWKVDEATNRLLDLERAKLVLTRAREYVEQFLACEAKTYLAVEQIRLPGTEDDVARRAVLLAAEEDVRCRRLDVDGECVICRAVQPEDRPARRRSLAHWLKRLMAWLKRQPERVMPDRAALQDIRVVLAVREDRYVRQIERLRMEENEALAHQAKEGNEPAPLAAVRQRISELEQFRQVVSSQRVMVETYLHQMEMNRIGSTPELPAQDELLNQGVAISRIIEQAQERAALAKAAREYATQWMPIETEDTGRVNGAIESAQLVETESVDLEIRAAASSRQQANDELGPQKHEPKETNTAEKERE